MSDAEAALRSIVEVPEWAAAQVPPVFARAARLAIEELERARQQEAKVREIAFQVKMIAESLQGIMEKLKPLLPQREQEAGIRKG